MFLAKRFMGHCPLRLAMVVPLVNAKGTTAPGRTGHWLTNSMRAISAFLLR
jgi:hypothetical protein